MVLLIGVDVIGSLSGWHVMRFSRPLRPLLLVYVAPVPPPSSHRRHHHVSLESPACVSGAGSYATPAAMRLVKAVGRTLPFVADIGLFAFVLLVVFSVIGVQFFDDDFVDDNGNLLRENFDDVPSAMLALFVLLSTE